MRPPTKEGRAHEEGLLLGVEAMRASVMDALFDPRLRHVIGDCPQLARVLQGMHPGYVKSGARALRDPCAPAGGAAKEGT